jgi:hypothetical protein
LEEADERGRSLSAVQSDEEVVPASEVKQLRTRIRQLERLLRKKILEDEVLKEALEVTREKNALAYVLTRKREFPVKRIAEALVVSRSNLYERQERGIDSRSRRSHHKAEDEVLLPMVREIVDERPTYGYPQATSMLNRHLPIFFRIGF